MEFVTKSFDNVDYSIWNKELLKSESSLASQTANWQYAFKENYDAEPYFISVTDSNGELLGQLAGVIHQKMFWKNANMFSKAIGMKLNLGRVLYWLYGPVVHKQSLRDEILDHILSRVNELAVEKKVSLISGVTSPMASKFKPEIWKKFGFKLQPWKTYIIDLNQPIDVLYKSLHNKIRYDIRKSEKQGFELEIVKDKKSLKEYHNLKIELKEIRGTKVRHKDFFESRWKLLHKQGYAQLLVAKLKGKMVGGVQVLTLNKNVIQHAIGNLPEHPMSGTFLTWNAIKWAKENKFYTFDFGGINPSPSSEKEKRIAFFKAKWQGKQYDYFFCTKKVNPVKYNVYSALKNPSKISQVVKHRLKL